MTRPPTPKIRSSDLQTERWLRMSWWWLFLPRLSMLWKSKPGDVLVCDIGRAESPARGDNIPPPEGGR